MNLLNPDSITHADLIVAIPSYNQAAAIPIVVKQTVKGLREYFPDFVSVIINLDDHSEDDTKRAFLAAQSDVPKIYLSTTPGARGRGRGLYSLFQEMLALNARAAVVVSADLTSLTPEWIRELAAPILFGYDYATPSYSHSETDNSIGSIICRPLIYGLLGMDIRFPIAGEIAISNNLAQYYLQQPWAPAAYDSGIDIFMTAHALLGGYECCQVALGAKSEKAQRTEPTSLLRQTLEILFPTLLANKDKWLCPVSLKPLRTFGEEKIGRTKNLTMYWRGVEASARREFQANRVFLSEILTSELFAKLTDKFERQQLTLETDLWMNVLYEILFVYDKREQNPKILETLKPFYWGRVLTLVNQAEKRGHKDFEDMFKTQAECFYHNRQVLTKKYEYKRAVA
jgi:glycosyltransferase involved in cell wall biosynthesis